MNRIAWALLLCLVAVPVHAQDARPLTQEAAAAMAAFYNRPSTIRLSGESRVPAGTNVVGDVASLGGPLVVAGRIDGDVLVINGDLRLRPGGRVSGRVTVVGGRLDGPPEQVGGPIAVYAEPLDFRREGDRILPAPGRPDSWLSAGRATPFGRVDLALTVDGSYNRVEGLPVSAGPRIRVGQSNPTTLEARVIYRTGSGLRFHPDELGHDVRLEQALGGRGSFRVGLGLHQRIDPIERNGLSDTENSLSTFILHRDYRDHYERSGWSGYLLYDGRTLPLDAGLEYRDESHASVRPRSPWSLLNNDSPWRAQPQVAEGRLETLRGWLRWDTRNDRVDPATGWLVQVDAEQGLDGDLRIAAAEPDALRGVRPSFTFVSLDVRRYLRLGPRTRVALRGVAAGSPDDDPLPPQRQLVLGGEGTLPGFDRFAYDCGARDQPLIDELVPYYGCDRSVLLQVEGRFALLADGSSPARAIGLDFDLLAAPELVVFADAGRAWVEQRALQGRQPGPASLRIDAGLGLTFGRLGFYFAAPLSREGDGANVFIRLGPRL